MKVLHHTIKNTKKEPWFGLIKDGIKKEEYKEIKPFWINRLTWHEYHWLSAEEVKSAFEDGIPILKDKWFDAHLFANGGHFGSNIPKTLHEAKGITIGYGKPEWGAEPGKKYFVIALGKKL